MSSVAAPRVAVITGAAQGIGYAIAHRLADDGLDIAVNDIPSKTEKLKQVVKEIEAKGRRAVSVPGDVSVEEDVKSMIEKAVAVLGGVDCMIANAGIVPFSPFLEMTAEQFDRGYAVNLRGVMLCYKYAALQMVKQGRGGRILGASSAAGREGVANLATYSATKFAIRGLTQVAAIELVKHKITVNAYAPGAITTGISLETAETAPAKSSGNLDQELFVPPYVGKAPPEVVASLISYLCKPEAYFITGQTISADGGWKLS